jgi:DNA-binding transcriptional LysR family regulator
MISADDLRFFAAIAASPSLAAAARALDVSPPAVTQRLHALEAKLGVHLLDRRGRHLTLTDEGELLAERGSEIIESLSSLSDALTERRGEVTGSLRVIAPFGFGRRHIAPMIAQFQTGHPRLHVDLHLSDRLGRTPEETWDIAIHVGALADVTPSLTLRHLAPNERYLCASPLYLSRFAAPKSPSDLRAHRCIALRENDEDVTLWRFRARHGGKDEKIRIDPYLASNDGDVVKEWALAGCGVILRSEWDVADDLRSGRLIRILDEHDLPAAPVVAFSGARRNARAARTRRFLDLLSARFQHPPWR